MPDASSLVRALTEQNPRWLDRSALSRDRHLRTLDASPVVWRPAVLDEIDLRRPSVYTVRGPRQVGKTTLLKLLIRGSVDRGFDPRRICYFSLDLQREPEQIVDLVRTAKTLVREPGPWTFLLDEVSSVPGWQKAIKLLRDQTGAAEDCFVLTGSSSLDVRAGAERLPGRRGPGTRLDKLLLPMSFREHCTATGVEPLESRSLAELVDPSPLRTDLVRLDEFDRALSGYLGSGGFAFAVRDLLEAGQVRPESFELLWSVVGGDVERLGRDRFAALKVLDRVVRSVGSPISWLQVARDAGMASPHTAESYASMLAGNFVLLVLYGMDPDRGPAPRKQKKLYASDPVIAHLPPMLGTGAPRPDAPSLVENVVATTLYRHVERDAAESFALPRALGHWRSSSGREIDFLVLGAPPSAVEVKYRDRITGKDREAIARSFGRGLILSREHFDPAQPVPVMPVSLFLASLDDRIGAAHA